MKTFLFILIALVPGLIHAQSVTITGTATLTGMTDHSAIQVEFTRIAPAPLVQVLTTDASGNYSGSVPVGLYNITYKRTGYLSVFLNSVNCFSTPVLAPQQLHKRSTRIVVPEMVPVVQHAIDNAVTGDTVMLLPGTYYENISMKGKRITLTSSFILTRDTADIHATILDGKNEKTVIACDQFEDSNTRIIGLTIRNGNAVGDYPDYFGGGIRCNSSSPTLEYLNIENNHAQYGGGGIYLHHSTSTISFVKVTGNSAGVDGGGIRLTTSWVTIRNAIIADNSAVERGGGIACTYFNGVGSADIINSTFINNAVDMPSDANDLFRGGSAIKAYGFNLSVKNSIFYSNTGDYAVSYYHYLESDQYPTIAYSLFSDNDRGNFFRCNPLLATDITENINETPVDAFFNVYGDPNFSEGHPYVPQAPSLAIDAGYNEFVDFETDIYGQPRIQNDYGHAVAHVNMGATESVVSATPVILTDGAICGSGGVHVSMSPGTKFNWYRSIAGNDFITQTGNQVTIDTLSQPITLYIANATYLIISERVAVSFQTYSAPEFTLEMYPHEESGAAKFGVTDAQDIITYRWYVANTELESDQENPVFHFNGRHEMEVCLEATNPCESLTACESFELLITDISENAGAVTFEVYPNPAQQSVTVKNTLGKEFSFDLINANGSKLGAQRNQSSYTVGLNHLVPGVYFIVIKPQAGEGKSRTFRLIKTQ